MLTVRERPAVRKKKFTKGVQTFEFLNTSTVHPELAVVVRQRTGTKRCVTFPGQMEEKTVEQRDPNSVKIQCKFSTKSSAFAVVRHTLSPFEDL